ncbi:MAG TPA: hypothetical protein VFI65_17250 [Streptosporangiaceae bacterium]|nr:hypothetical protein [Streptosporangiaceae bacterium]
MIEARQHLRRHWLFVSLLGAGVVLRVLASVANRPALIYIDTMKYLYNAYPGADPVGYKAPLKLILAVGNLETVAAIQHLLGLAIAVTIYVTLTQLSVPRWLGALAAAPVLLDAYQLQIEQTIMPDVWFEALIVAAIAILLLTPSRGAKGRKILRNVLIAGLLLGLSATFRQVGEVLFFPVLVYLAIVGGGWRAVLIRSAAFIVAFAVPILGYMTGSYYISRHFWLDSASLSVSTYGRMATAADCATLRIPAYERPLCPNARQRAYGVDWLDHDAASPLKTYVAPHGLNRYAVISSFDHQVAEQQPARVAAAIADDGSQLFAIDRTSSQTGTPISRWQFQTAYPTYPSWVTLSRTGMIVFGLRLTPAGGPLVRHPLEPGYGGRATVNRPVATFLRGYQLADGYTPGPALALLTLAGLLGSILAVITRLRRRAAASRPQLNQVSLACLLFFCCGGAVLLMSDAFQFSWRYQLPALITLPPAGVLGIAAITAALRGRRLKASADQPASTGQPADKPQTTSPAM